MHAAPGTDPAVLQQVYTQMLGPIGHFYGKARQVQQIGGLPQIQLQQTLPNAHLRYVYNNGQETVHISLAAGSPTSESKPVVTPTDYWDLALIEIEIEDMVDPVGQPKVAAFVVPEKPGETDYATTFGDTSGGALTFASDEEDIIDTVTEGTTWFGSLKVDISKLRGVPVLKIALYAGITKIAGPPPNTFPAAFRVRSYTLDPAGSDIPGYTPKILGDYVLDLPNGFSYDRVLDEFPEVSAYSPKTPGQLILSGDAYVVSSDMLSTYGATYFRNYFLNFGDGVEDITTVTTDWVGGTTGALRTSTTFGTHYRNRDPLGPYAPGLPDPVYTNVELGGADSITYWLPLDPDPADRPHTAHLSSLFFRRGDPLKVVSKLEYDVATSYRWEDAAIYPRRSPMNEIPQTVTVRAIRIPEGSSVANHFGLRLLGTFTLDLEHAVTSWKPA